MNNFDPSYVVNTKDIGFKFAWGIETTYNPQPKFDSNYVQWVAEMPINNDDTIGHSRLLKFHKCTDDDYDSFYPPSNAFKNNFQALKASKTLFCIDESEIMEIYGGSHASQNQMIEVVLIPCNANSSAACTTTKQ